MGIKNNLSLHFIYLVSCKIILSNSRTSNLWKLNSDNTKIVEGSPFYQVVGVQNGVKNPHYVTDLENDPVFNILTSSIRNENGWENMGVEYFCSSCNKGDYAKKSFNSNSSKLLDLMIDDNEDALDCGRSVNFTYYDNLVGVINRNRHPNVPEPQAALVFSKSKKLENGEFDIDSLERRLRKAKKEKPKSVHLYNQIGNFWRIKGNTQKSIECFRRALAVSPHNSEVLLNLARVLFTLQYLDDAIYLTRRSLEVLPPEKGAWQQYFTLGEIFKVYGHYQEASLHLKHALELKPGFEPAINVLKEMEAIPTDSIHIYTLVIIICLVLGVLLVILSSVDTISDLDYHDSKPHRHFNKAMAMKTLRGFGMKHPRPKKLTL